MGIGRFLTHSIWVTKNWGCWGPAPLGKGVADYLETPLSVTCVTMHKFGHSRSNHTSVINEDPPENIDPSRSAFQGHLRVSRNWHGSIGYLWLPISDPYMGLCTVSVINGDFGRKSQIFPTPVYFASPLKEFLLELGISARGKKTRIMVLPGRERSLTMSSAVWIQHTNVTDGQTNNRMDRGRQQRPR